MSKLSEFLNYSLNKFKDKVCLSDKKHSLTYSELVRSIDGTSSSFKDNGIGHGDHIALFVENSVEYIILYFALLKTGAVVVPIDFTSGIERQRFIIKDCNIRAIIVRRKADDNYPCEELLVDQMITSGGNSFDNHTIYETDIACIMYTTGSTGNPKGVVLTHANVYASLSNISKYMGYTDSNRELVALPITHSFGLNQVLCNLMNGGFAYLIHGFANSGRILRLLEFESITNFPGTPTSYKMLLDKYLTPFKTATQSLHTILINSSPLSPAFAKYILTMFPSVRLMVYYGLTEASRSTFHTHSLNLSEKHLSCVGKATPNVEVQISDENGKQLPPMEEGEVIVRADTIMKSYWNNQEETEKTINNNWFKTGDLGYLDDEGYLFLSGRIKDQINIGGLKTSSVEIKKALESLDNVNEAFVFGKQDELYGEIPVACLVFDTPLNKDELIEGLEKLLDKFKIPHVFYNVNSIPKSITGKVLKADLVESIRKEEPIA